MGKKRNILLDTINNSYDLGQVLSTYGRNAEILVRKFI